MLPTKKRRDEREPLPRQRGGEELLPNGSMWSLGTLEPKQENTWCDGQPHGFTLWLCRKYQSSTLLVFRSTGGGV